MTSNQHGPYVRGDTRVTMAGTAGSQAATPSGTRKPVSVRIGDHPFQIRAVSMESIEPEKPDIKKLCRELKPYCTQAEIKQLEQMESIFQTMEMYQEMSQTMSAMQEMFPDMGTDSADGVSASPSMEDILMGMLSPEQKAMYENFSNSNFALE